MTLTQLANRVRTVCEDNQWDKTALPGGCYIHLEVSEFIEALRGKGNSSAEQEAGDVIIALLAVMSHYNISPDDVIKAAEKTITRLEQDIEMRQRDST